MVCLCLQGTAKLPLAFAQPLCRPILSIIPSFFLSRHFTSYHQPRYPIQNTIPFPRGCPLQVFSTFPTRAPLTPPIFWATPRCLVLLCVASSFGTPFLRFSIRRFPSLSFGIFIVTAFYSHRLLLFAQLIPLPTFASELDANRPPGGNPSTTPLPSNKADPLAQPNLPLPGISVWILPMSSLQ